MLIFITILIMKTVFIVFGFFGLSLARPQNPLDAYITRYDNDNNGLGPFSFNVETSDGFRHEQTGELKNAGTDDEALVMRGSYSYVGLDGVTYTVNYVADEDGFRPSGDHLPPSAGVRPKHLRLSPAAQASLIGGGIG